MGSRAVPG